MAALLKHYMDIFLSLKNLLINTQPIVLLGHVEWGICIVTNINFRKSANIAVHLFSLIQNLQQYSVAFIQIGAH